jgi:hypothetical protein
MKQDIYIYYFKNDTKCEALGRVMATSLDEARELISERKALNVNLISDLFVIKKLENHENIIQLDNN